MSTLKIAVGQGFQPINGGPAEAEGGPCFNGFFAREFIRKTFDEKALVSEHPSNTIFPQPFPPATFGEESNNDETDDATEQSTDVSAE